MSCKNASAALANLSIWHHIDAKGMVIGRLANAIVPVLCGKHKPVYHPTIDVGDYIVVTNMQHAHYSSAWRDKSKPFYWHTRYPGGLRQVTSGKVRELKESIMGIPGRGAEQLLYRAVKGMLPRNGFRKIRLQRLKVFNGSDHPYKANIFTLNT
jgi:large subunit ribosomal protein L13